jgi:phenylalanyl-tRNA synthetase beta subunit
MNNKNKTYISRNIIEKLQLIIEIENNKKIKDVLKEFGVKQSIILTLHKNRDSLKWQGNQNPTAVKSKKIRIENVRNTSNSGLSSFPNRQQSFTTNDSINI